LLNSVGITPERAKIASSSTEKFKYGDGEMIEITRPIATTEFIQIN
jgi:hypothetical protein